METLLERWGRFVARWPLAIVILWIIVVVVALKFGPSLGSVSTKQNTSSLPSSAPSVQADQLYTTKFAAGQLSVNKENDILVLTNPQGISTQDIAHITQIQSWLTSPATRPAQLFSVTGPNTHTPATFFESADHKALRVILTWNIANSAVPGSSIKAVNDYLTQQHVSPGGTLGLTGSAPISYGLETSFTNTSSSGPNFSSLIGYLIILVVLVIVYRSPLAVLLPLISVAMAVLLSIPIIAWFGQHLGMTVDPTISLEYVGFVLLGAGTNYGVFMLSRYKEEIRRSSENTSTARHEALARTIGHVGESITSSAATVVIATAIMGVAQLYMLRLTGPAVAIGVVCLLLAGLSLLPALMALCGKALFWPVQPHPNTLTDTSAVTKGIWARAGQLVTTHPRLIIVTTLIILLPLAISSAFINPSFDDLKSLPTTSSAVQAFNSYSAHFKDTAQTTVLLNAPGHDLRQAQYSATITRVATALSHVQHVSNVQSPTTSPHQQLPQFFATDGSAVALTTSLDIDPSSNAAPPIIDALNSTATTALQGTSLNSAAVLISGQTAYTHDEVAQFNHDFVLVVTLVCLAIYIILTLLVRSFTAPLYLLGTIALSALTAVGITNLVYNKLLGYPLFSIVPIFAFVFLVSLGEDFNILTIARIREEVQKLGHHKGIATAIALTGGVVSSCGLVMAASFSRMTTLAVVEIVELGFTVMVGILLDTFIVRPLLVPALVTILGRWNWVWPNSQLFKPEIADSLKNNRPHLVETTHS